MAINKFKKFIGHAFRFICIILVSTIAGQCISSFYRNAKFDDHIQKLKSFAKPGDNIFEAKDRISGKFHYIYGPFNSETFEQELNLTVDFGLNPAFIDHFAGLKTYKSSVTIRAKRSGEIFSIEVD